MQPDRGFGENTAPSTGSLRINSSPGDLVFLDLGGCFNGYFSDFTRTVLPGPASEPQKKIYTAVYETMMNIVETMKPGVTNEFVNRSRGRSSRNMVLKIRIPRPAGAQHRNFGAHLSHHRRTGRRRGEGIRAPAGNGLLLGAHD